MPSLILMVLSDDLDPKQITKLLGMRPTQSWRKGDLRQYVARKGQSITLKSSHEFGGWKRRLPDFPAVGRIDDGPMSKLLQRLLPRKRQIRAFARRGYKFYLVVLIQEPASLLIPSRIQRSLSDLEIRLRIDFLPP